MLLTVPALAENARPTAPPSSDPFAVCDEKLAGDPHNRRLALCFVEQARNSGEWVEGAQRVTRWIHRGTDNPWLELALGQVLLTPEAERAKRVLEDSAAHFADEGDLEGEQFARLDLHRIYLRNGERDPAAKELERVVELGQISGRPLLEDRATIETAKDLLDNKEDYGRALRLAERVRRRVFPDGDSRLQVECLNIIGAVHSVLGQPRQALGAYLKLAELAKHLHDAYTEGLARNNIFLNFLRQLRSPPTADDRHRAVDLARASIASAKSGGNLAAELAAHLELAKLVDGPERETQLTACMRVAAIRRSPSEKSRCLRVRALSTGQSHPELLDETLGRARALALASEDPWAITSVKVDGMIARWKAGQHATAFEASSEALEAIEALRDIQTSSENRARVFSSWSTIYYWLSGELLQTPEASLGDQLDEAFQVIERMRSRQLLAALDAAQVTPPDPQANEIRLQLASIQREIARVQRRLLRPDLTEEQRRQAMTALEIQELEQDDIRGHLNEFEPRQSDVEHQEIASLAKVSARLEPDQALLSFQLAGWEDIYGDFDGGSWLLVVTRDGTRVYRLPEPARIAAAVRIFRGFLERRDGSGRPAGVRLYEVLLRKALADLPASVTKLVVIPDGPLHHLPLGALRPQAEAPPLVTRYAISRAPSATLWLRWRREQPRPQGAVLILADPPIPHSDSKVASATRQWSLARDARLGSLPRALAEGRAAARYLGSAATLRTGLAANERFLKTVDLTGISLLHFAAHAIDDEDRPERAGILLSPGAEDEDGLLQIHEIVELPLAGVSVVLSACGTASGTVLRGEGVMSLARGFFAAGAHSVVGTLWRLRDDDGEKLFTAFYRHLARGMSVGDALQAAQLDRLRAGDPTVAWAGVVVLGDAEVRPVAPRPWLGPIQLALGLPLVVFVAAAVWSFVRWRRQVLLSC